jgi:ubiquinone/menaquinone biosynthesis C-methylase UbiE
VSGDGPPAAPPPDVARLFDRLAASYDELEPWYEHLYARLHAILDETLVPGRSPARALDVGCGTGFQTARLARLGHAAHGVDVSAGLLGVAVARVPHGRFARGSAEALPYASGAFDAVTCCGSVLSLLDRPERALGEMGRVLRPGGLLLLECERRWTLDLGWSLLSSLTADALGYGASPRAAWRALAAPARDPVVIDYPCALDDGAAASLRLRLFTRRALDRMLGEAGLVGLRAWGIHGVTNLLPSTLLHRPRLPAPLRVVYRALAALDRGLAPRRAGRALANSLVVLATRR